MFAQTINVFKKNPMKQRTARYLWKIEWSPIDEEKLAIIVASANTFTDF